MRAKLNRQQKRRMLFASDHVSNNRKATPGRIVQVVTGKNGSSKQLRFNP